MAAILNAALSAVNRLFSGLGNAVDMDATWRRISKRVADFPNGAGREVAWLAEALNTTQQRVFNWQKRGVPSGAHQDIAAALKWSVGQLLGIDEEPSTWPFSTIEPQRFLALNPHQRAMVELAARQEIERIEAVSRKATGSYG
jgi:hypothetical protein